MKMKKILASIIAITMITTILTGCSTNKEDTKDTSSLPTTETTSTEDSIIEESTNITSDKEDTDEKIDSKEENLEAKEIFEKTKENVDKADSLTLEMILSMDASIEEDDFSTTMSASSTSIVDMTKNTSHTIQNSTISLDGELYQDASIEEYRVKVDDKIIIYENSTGEWKSSTSTSSSISNMEYVNLFKFDNYTDMTIEKSDTGHMISIPISKHNDILNQLLGSFINDIDSVDGKIKYWINDDYYPISVIVNTSENLSDGSTQVMSVKLSFNNWNELTDEDNAIPELVKANAVESPNNEETKSTKSDVEELNILLDDISITLPGDIKVDSKWTKEVDFSNDSLDFYTYDGSSLCLYYMNNTINGISLNAYNDINIPKFTINGVGIGSTIDDMFKVFGEVNPSFDGDSFASYTYDISFDNKHYIIEFSNYFANEYMNKDQILDMSISVY